MKTELVTQSLPAGPNVHVYTTQKPSHVDTHASFSIHSPAHAFDILNWVLLVHEFRMESMTQPLGASNGLMKETAELQKC